jgi:hypothetical protein
MTVTAFSTILNTPVALTGQARTLVISLRLPNTGKYVVWGKVTIKNAATTPQAGGAFMTTFDGATPLDGAGFEVAAPAGEVAVSLQSGLDLSNPTQNEIVDIRCSTANATATTASLIAIQVDALSGPVGPGT